MPITSTLQQQGHHRTINEFKKMFKNFASPARYAVDFFGGSQVFPESITLPARGFSFFTDAQYGAIRQYPYRRQFNTEIVMTIPVSEDQSQRKFFENWMNGLIPSNEVAIPVNTSPNTVNMTISCLDHFDVPQGTFSLYGAFPSSIIPSNYGYGMLNETAKLQVTITYRKYDYK